MEKPMDFIKKKVKKTSNVVTVYLKEKDLQSLEYLREMNVNVSMVCRKAIREIAQKMLKDDEPSLEDEMLIVKCEGHVTIDFAENKFLFENYEILKGE